MDQDEILYWEYERVDSERSVDAENFDNGEIVYKKFLSTSAKINLARSFLKLIVTISDSAGNNLDLNDNLAPAFLASETLFKSMYYRINNVIVSEIGDYVAQICALNGRVNNSKGFRDSVLKDMNWGKPEFSERQKSVLSSVGGELIDEYDHPSALATTADILGMRADANAGAAVVQADHGLLHFSVALAAGTLNVGDEVRVAGCDYCIVRPPGAAPGVIDNQDWFVSPVPPDDIAATVNWQRKVPVNNHREARQLEIIFRPSLGIFQKDEWILGHDLELSLFPHSNPLYKKFFMESLFADKIPGLGNDYDVVIQNMIFYPCIGYVEHSLEQGEYTCSFLETRMQIQNITTSTDIDRTFVIDKNTKQITMALQDARATGGNTLFSRTKFKVGKNSADPAVDTDLDLKSYVILYDIYQFPRPQHDQETTGITDRIAQAYYENLAYSGQYQYLPDMEDYSEFKKLGPYYRYKIPIRKGQSNPKLSIKTSFRSAFSADAKPNLLLFDTFQRSFKLVAKNGRVVEVTPQSQAQ